MRILLIQPPLNKKSFSFGQLEPLGLEILAGAVPQHEVEIMDMRFEKNLNRKLNSFKPHLVGVTAYTIEVPLAKKILQEIKYFNKDILTIVGGHHASMMTEDFNEPFVDIIVKGHGFTAFAEIANIFENRGDLLAIKGIALAKGGKLFFTEPKTSLNVDEMPLPNRRLTKKYRLRYNVFSIHSFALMTTSLGCPYRCNFCACWKFTEGRYLTRSPEVVVEEMASIEEKFIFFGDDNTFHSIKRAEQIYNLIKEKGIKKRYAGYARSDTIAKYPEIIRKWKEIGLTALIVGLEGTSDKDLVGCHKNNSLRNNEAAIEILKENDVTNLAHFLVSPDFGREDFNRLSDYVERKNLTLPFFTMLTPLPATQLWEEQKDQIVLKDYEFFDLAHMILPTKLAGAVFIRQVAKLYFKAYSIRRYLKAVLYNLLLKRCGKKRYSEKKISHLHLKDLLIMRIGFIVAFRRMKRIYEEVDGLR